MVTGLEKKNFLWPTSEHRGQEFGGRSIVPKRRHSREGWLLMWSFVVVILQKSVCGHWFWKRKKKTKFIWPTSEHRGQEFGERSIVFKRRQIREV